MTVRARLALTLGAVIVILVLPALYGLNRLHELRSLTSELRERHAPAWVALGELRTSLSEFDKAQRSFVAAPDSSSRRAMNRALDSARLALANLETAGYGEEARRTASLVEELRGASLEIEALVGAGEIGAATRRFQEVKPLFRRTLGSLGPVAETVDERSASVGRQARSISETASWTVLLSLVGAVVLALLLALWITGSLTRPLLRLRHAMANVARGEMEAPRDLPYGRSDEIGDLSRSFRVMTEKLAELNRLRAEFVGIATHKLKNPLNVLAGYAELLEEELASRLEPAHRETIDAMREQVEVLTRYIGRLLDVSRVESGELDVQPAPFHLRDMLRAVESSYRPAAERREVALQVEIAPDTPELVVGDEERLREEVMGNLLDNALKFTQAGGSVRVRAAAEDSRLTLEVQDEGLGIPEDDLPHIFDKFYQSARGARTLGTGLGLAITRQIVEAHGGRVEAESDPGEGALFRVLLPLEGRDGDGAAAPAVDEYGDRRADSTTTGPPPGRTVPERDASDRPRQPAGSSDPSDPAPPIAPS